MASPYAFLSNSSLAPLYSCQQWSPPGSSSCELTATQKGTDGANRRQCTLEFNLYLFGSFLGSLSVILTILIFNVGSIFLFQPRPGRLATLPWTYYGHIAFTIDMLVYSLHAIYTDEALLSLVHVQRGAHDNAKQVDHLSLFK